KPQKTKAPARTVDIFKVLKQIDLKDATYYTALEEHEQKQLHPLVMMRWMSGVSDPNVIQMLNYTVNPYVFSLVNHKELLMRSLLISASGAPRRYQWLAKAKEKNKNKHVEVVKQYYRCSSREAAMHMVHHSIDDIVMMAEELGYQDDEIKQ